MSSVYECSRCRSYYVQNLNDICSHCKKQVSQNQSQQIRKHKNQNKNQNIPPLDQLLTIYDFQSAVKQKLKINKLNNEGFYYFETGAEDEYTLRENEFAFRRIWLRPRILMGVNHCSNIDTSIELFNGKISSSLPFYITAFMRSNLLNKDIKYTATEISIMKAANNNNMICMLPAGSTIPLNKVLKHKNPKQVLWLQLYTMNISIDPERKYLKEKLDLVISNNIEVICITVDLPCYVKREKYLKGTSTEHMINLSPSLLNPSMNWLFIKWIYDNYCKKYDIKLLLKGVGCSEDVLKAYYFEGVSGVILSNHGGRALEYSRSSIEVLIECIDLFKKSNINLNNNDNNFELFIDGGIRRGSDIFKALCLGVKCVGIGRPIAYGLTCYGQDGIEKVINILKNELIKCMRMMGVNSIKDIKKNMITYKKNKFHMNFVPINYIKKSTYKPVAKL